VIQGEKKSNNFLLPQHRVWPVTVGVRVKSHARERIRLSAAHRGDDAERNSGDEIIKIFSHAPVLTSLEEFALRTTKQAARLCLAGAEIGIDNEFLQRKAQISDLLRLERPAGGKSDKRV